MNANIITHSILYNTKKVHESIAIMEECITIMRKACFCKTIIRKLVLYQEQYKTVANALITDYDIPEENKVNRFIVLEELIDLIFDQLEKNKELFKFENKKKTDKLLYEKRFEIKELLRHNELTLSNLIDRHSTTMAFACFVIMMVIFIIKSSWGLNDYDILSRLTLYIIWTILISVSLALFIKFMTKGRRKGRFTRPTSRDKIMTYMGFGLTLLISFITLFWDKL